jgi:hypothetical protein
MRPTDCALVVTVPLLRSEFMSDYTAGTDFLEHFVRPQRSRDLDVLWAIYEASAAPAAASIDRAARRGVTVRRRAALADFARCLEQFAVVTLVAHWRSSLFRASDILDPGAVRRLLPEALPRERDGPGIEGLVAALNRRLRDGPVVGAPVVSDDSRGAALATRHQYALWQARRELEPLLGSAIRSGGPAVEFVDGLASVDRVVSAVPQSFEGVLDLTVCNSTLLAEEIRRRRRGGLIIANAFPATLDIRMEFYNAVVDVMQRRQVSYQDAVFAVRQKVRRQS